MNHPVHNNFRMIMNIFDIPDDIYDRYFGSHKSFYKTKCPSNLTHMT